MGLSTRNAICLFIIICVVPFVMSIKCFDCQSNKHPKCADPFDNSTFLMTNCEHEDGFRSICQKIRQKVDGVPVIIRGCASKKLDDFSKTCPSSLNHTFCVTCDDHDGCNGASATGKTIALLIAPLSLLLFK